MKTKHHLTAILILSFITVNAQTWVNNLDQAKLLAKSNQKFLLVDFYADWCGPCKEMDSRTWNQPEVQLQLQKMVPVKIDIDRERVIAARFNVKSIPHIFILDQLGNKLYEIEGYQSASEMERILAEFPGQIEKLSHALTALEQNPDNPEENVKVAVAYQNQAKRLNDKGMNVMLNTSAFYLKRAQKEYKNADNPVGMEQTELLEIYNSLLRGQSRKAIKKLEKTGIEKVHPSNQSMAFFIASAGYMEEGDNKKAKQFADKLAHLSGCETYVNELKSMYSGLIQ